MELFSIAQAPVSIDVDENSIEESLCEPGPITFSNNVASVTGAHKTIFIGPRGESLHKEELLVSQAKRDVHHCIKYQGSSLPVIHHGARERP